MNKIDSKIDSNANSKTIKLVIFDWDGTISDSVARIVSSMQSAATELDMAVPTYLEVKEIIGLGLTEDVSTAASRVDVWLACRPGSCW